MTDPSPTQRTMEALQANGLYCTVVERRDAKTRRTHDLLGFGDILALDRDGILLIQATSGPNHSIRVRKIVEECNEAALAWVRAGGIIEVWSWLARVRKRGRPERDWTARIERVTEEMLDGGA